MADRSRIARLLGAHPVVAACTAAIATLALRVAGEQPSWSWVIGPFVVPVLSYACGAYAGRRDGLVATLVLMAALQVATGFEDFPNIELTFLTLGPWWAGREVQLRRLLSDELANRAAQLEAEEDAFVDLSVQRERGRIARELHDIVAHHLAVIVVQAGAGRMAASVEDAAAAERLRSVARAGREALAELARLLDVIQPDARQHPDRADRLAALLEQVRAGGLDVDVQLSPTARTVHAALGDDALQIVREGLTNAMKHANGARVVLRLELAGDWLEVDVRDSGAVTPSSLADAGAGLGLRGMRERIESGGGTLQAGPDGGGWLLHARLPVA